MEFILAISNALWRLTLLWFSFLCFFIALNIAVRNDRNEDFPVAALFFVTFFLAAFFLLLKYNHFF
jgi:hypothetical protein